MSFSLINKDLTIIGRIMDISIINPTTDFLRSEPFYFVEIEPDDMCFKQWLLDEAEVASGPDAKLNAEMIGPGHSIYADTIVKPRCNYAWEPGDKVSIKVRSELKFSDDHKHSFLNLHLRFVDPIDGANDFKLAAPNDEWEDESCD